VSERWVCKRCFADNEETDAVCRHCNLIRGAESTPDDSASWAAGAETAKAETAPGWRRWVRFWWVPALVIFLVVGYLASAKRDDGGAITAAGSLPIEDLRIGDCFNSDESDEISSVDARPCGEAHQFEMFHVATWDGSSTYPTEEAMSNFVLETCVPAFGTYVGTSYQASELDFVPFYPVEEGWDSGIRTFQCAIYDPGAGLTESQRGAAR